jgi:tetratricopeptide (TPR) repeat protein
MKQHYAHGCDIRETQNLAYTIRNLGDLCKDFGTLLKSCSNDECSEKFHNEFYEKAREHFENALEIRKHASVEREKSLSLAYSINSAVDLDNVDGYVKKAREKAKEALQIKLRAYGAAVENAILQQAIIPLEP